jgi:hypothetical protein
VDCNGLHYTDGRRGREMILLAFEILLAFIECLVSYSHQIYKLHNYFKKLCSDPFLVLKLSQVADVGTSGFEVFCKFKYH